MFANLNKKIELAANATIILVAALLCVVLAKNHLLSAPVANTKADVSQTRQAANQLPIGTHLSYLDLDWKQSPQTLVLAISSVCHFCTESGSFYKTVMQNRKNTRVIAVLPQPVEEGKSYLQKLGVSVDEVRQLPLDKIGAHGTPTLLLVANTGVVKEAWIGKLSSDKEAEVLSKL